MAKRPASEKILLVKRDQKKQLREHTSPPMSLVAAWAFPLVISHSGENGGGCEAARVVIIARLSQAGGGGPVRYEEKITDGDTHTIPNQKAFE